MPNLPNALKPAVFPAMVAVLLAFPAVSQEKGAPAGDVHVPVAAALARDTIAPGSAGVLTFRFSPRKGFHVNATPPMSVAFDSAAPAKGGGRIEVPADTATGYLKASLPVRQPFTLLASAKKGRSELRGVLTYYYCSDSEGWCRKENLPFTVPITVK